MPMGSFTLLGRSSHTEVEDMVKASEIKGRAVVSLERVQKIGAVQGLVFDPSAARVAGLQVGGVVGQEGGGHYVPAEAVYKIGPDAITVRDVGATPTGDQAAWQHLPSSGDLGQCKVVTDGGTFLGQISDVLIDESTLAIQGYDLGGGGLLDQLAGRSKFLPAQPGFRFGNGLMLVPDALAAAVQQGVQPGAQPAQPAPVAPTDQPVAAISPEARADRSVVVTPPAAMPQAAPPGPVAAPSDPTLPNPNLAARPGVPGSGQTVYQPPAEGMPLDGPPRSDDPQYRQR
jgi:uncharacterized protein YrrD